MINVQIESDRFLLITMQTSSVEEIPAIRAKAPGQLLSVPCSETDFGQLNVHWLMRRTVSGD